MKTRCSISIISELYDWAKTQVAARRFGSMSHAIECGLMKLKESDIPADAAPSDITSDLILPEAPAETTETAQTAPEVIAEPKDSEMISV